jgi:hypothetical protein
VVDPAVRGAERPFERQREPKAQENRDLAEARAVRQPPEEQRVDGHAKDEEGRCRDEYRDEGIDAAVPEQEERDVGGKHHERAVREVDDLHDAVDHREA